MNEDDWKAFFKAVALVAGVFIIIALIMDATTPKCIKSGCDNEQASGSSYCYLHKLYSSSSSYKSSTKNYSSSSGRSKSSGSTSSKKSTSTSSSKNYSSNPYKSYDEGYDDVYDNDDYDWDRYYSDDDYADGVDDAMDELDW